MLQCMVHQLADLSFGQRQIEQFISDRPDAGEIIKHEPVLRETLVRLFAGEVTGYRFHWDNREPIGRQPAEHMSSKRAYPSVIRISCNPDAVDKCFMLLFELNNFQVDKEIERLWSATPDERPSRDNFATSCVRHEFDALKQTRLFFKRHPNAESNSQNGPYYNSIMASNMADFTKYLFWLSSLDKSEFNPLEYYGEVYDHEMDITKREKKREQRGQEPNL